jgi:hypothetical protein
VTESRLDKVLRLSGGITRSYTRVNQGRVQRVGAYASRRRVAWGSLKAGEVVEIAGVRYKVLQVRVPPAKPKQPGPNTKGTVSGKSTGSAGKGVNTKGPAGSGALSPGKAALGGQKAPAGGQKVTSVLQNLSTGNRYYVSLPVNWPLTALS